MKVLVLANFGMGLYNFRREILEELINKGYEVIVSFPEDEYVPKLKKIGCKFVETQVDRRGTNPVKDLKLLLNYVKIIKQIKPNIVLTFTIKPNIYGGIACNLLKTPYITNITGLGTSIENKGILQKITLFLYKLGLKKASCVFFQNQSNKEFFLTNDLVSGKIRIIPGSGVNLAQHTFEGYPANDNKLKFLFIGRIMKAKGIEELLEAAKIIKKKHPYTQFNLIGGMEENYLKKLRELENQNVIKYYGQQKDVHSFIKESHAIVLPSYHEGLSNVLLESASTGRPVLASRVPGCSETFDEDITGIGFEVKNVKSLVGAIEKFISLPYKSKVEMGKAGRAKVEKEFDRRIVIDSYLDEISKIDCKEKTR